VRLIRRRYRGRKWLGSRVLVREATSSLVSLDVWLENKVTKIKSLSGDLAWRGVALVLELLSAEWLEGRNQ
jgi:hypothetical protein